MPIADDGRIQLFASHESYFNLNATNWGIRDGYDRMRNGCGIEFPLAKRARIDVGYLNEYSFRHASPDRELHIALITIGRSF